MTTITYVQTIILWTCNEEWTIQRNWQHLVHKTRTNKQNKIYNTICAGHHHTQDEDKQIKKHNMQASTMLERYQSNNNPLFSKENVPFKTSLNFDVHEDRFRCNL